VELCVSEERESTFSLARLDKVQEAFNHLGRCFIPERDVPVSGWHCGGRSLLYVLRWDGVVVVKVWCRKER
jgi:hypothetical protein